MAVPHQTGRARSGELSIHYRKLGTPGDTPILIVHGLSYFSYDWLGVAHSLGAGREVVAMDMRGFGDSDWSPSHDYGVPAMAEDIVSVLDHLRWTRALLVGHSMGGRSAACAAARHPHRVAGLVLVDYSPENAPTGARRTTELVGNQPDAFASIEAAMRYFGKGDRERFAAYLKKTDSGASFLVWMSASGILRRFQVIPLSRYLMLTPSPGSDWMGPCSSWPSPTSSVSMLPSIR